MLSLKNVHGISPINIKIFNKFFIGMELNNSINCKSPC